MSKLIDLTNQKFGRLTAISFENGKWTCICECQNTLIVDGSHLTNGNTKSCGCYKKDNLISRAHKLAQGKRQFEPRISSARRVWQNTYCYRDPECLGFEDFLIISQQNCFYCGMRPNTMYNYFASTSSRSSEKAKQEGTFIYNGMDRIDSSKSHTTDNTVPACQTCNRAKNDRAIEDFLSWVNNLKITSFKPINIVKTDFPTNGSLATSVRCVFYNHKRDTDLTVEEYYSISQMNCFYCDGKPNNIFNRAKTDKKASLQAKENGNYIYNGIDRIDIDLSHNKNNVVPCCYYCNWAKNKLALSEFYDWIRRVKYFQGQN